MRLGVSPKDVSGYVVREKTSIHVALPQTIR